MPTPRPILGLNKINKIWLPILTKGKIGLWGKFIPQSWLIRDGAKSLLKGNNKLVNPASRLN